MGKFVLARIGMKAVVAIGMLICPVSPSVGAETDGAGPPTRYALSDVTITLDRKCGLGPCPSYVVSIHGGGRVIYEGREHVETMGRSEAKIETAF